LRSCQSLLTTCKGFFAPLIGFYGSIAFAFQSGFDITTLGVFGLSGSYSFLTTIKSFFASTVRFNSGIALSFNFCDLISAAFMFGFGFDKGFLTPSMVLSIRVSFTLYLGNFTF